MEGDLDRVRVFGGIDFVVHFVERPHPRNSHRHRTLWPSHSTQIDANSLTVVSSVYERLPSQPNVCLCTKEVVDKHFFLLQNLPFLSYLCPRWGEFDLAPFLVECALQPAGNTKSEAMEKCHVTANQRKEPTSYCDCAACLRHVQWHVNKMGCTEGSSAKKKIGSALLPAQHILSRFSTRGATWHC